MLIAFCCVGFVILGAMIMLVNSNVRSLINVIIKIDKSAYESNARFAETARERYETLEGLCTGTRKDVASIATMGVKGFYETKSPKTKKQEKIAKMSEARRKWWADKKARESGIKSPSLEEIIQSHRDQRSS